MEVHPVAEMFPMLTDEELETLALDIQENGLRQPVVTHEGMLLDGRNRLAACELVGVEPTFTEYPGDDLVAFIISMNLQRRNLTSGQRACIGVLLLPPLVEEGKKLGLANLKQFRDETAGDLKVSPRGRAAVLAGGMVGVNNAYISWANRLSREAPDLFAEVKSGEITLTRANMILQQRQLPQMGSSSSVTNWKPSYQVREDIGNSQSSADEVTSGTGAGFVAETLNLLARMADTGFLPTDTKEAERGLAALVKHHVDYVVPRLVAAYLPEGTE